MQELTKEQRDIIKTELDKLSEYSHLFEKLRLKAKVYYKLHNKDEINIYLNEEDYIEYELLRLLDAHDNFFLKFSYLDQKSLDALKKETEKHILSYNEENLTEEFHKWF